MPLNKIKNITWVLESDKDLPYFIDHNGIRKLRNIFSIDPTIKFSNDEIKIIKKYGTGKQNISASIEKNTRLGIYQDNLYGFAELKFDEGDFSTGTLTVHSLSNGDRGGALDTRFIDSDQEFFLRTLVDAQNFKLEKTLNITSEDGSEHTFYPVKKNIEPLDVVLTKVSFR